MSSEYLLVLLKQQPECLRIHVLGENKIMPFHDSLNIGNQYT